MSEIITTLHEKGTPLNEVYPNIKSDNIPENAVTTPKILNSAVTSDKINNGAITTDKINDSAVTTSKINNNAIVTSKISNDAITTDKINDNAVTSVKINDSAVTSDKINNGAVTSSKINNNALKTINGYNLIGSGNITLTGLSGYIHNVSLINCDLDIDQEIEYIYGLINITIHSSSDVAITTLADLKTIIKDYGFDDITKMLKVSGYARIGTTEYNLVGCYVNSNDELKFVAVINRVLQNVDYSSLLGGTNYFNDVVQ